MQVTKLVFVINKISAKCRKHIIICQLFVAHDLSGLGWALKEGRYDMGNSATGGETDAVCRAV
jgi:hypothetical protein